MRRKCMNLSLWVVNLAILSSIAAMIPASAYASNFGAEGIINVPSARMSDDGSLTATISSSKAVNLFNVTYQATPWAETTFRYAVFNPYKKESSSDNERDRSYGLKLRIVKEKEWRPQNFFANRRKIF